MIFPFSSTDISVDLTNVSAELVVVVEDLVAAEVVGGITGLGVSTLDRELGVSRSLRFTSDQRFCAFHSIFIFSRFAYFLCEVATLCENEKNLRRVRFFHFRSLINLLT